MSTSSDRPPLSFWQIWNMSFGFLGIQFGWALQMANMSAIYQFLGAEEGDIAMLWLAAPLTGLLVQPIVGYYSDRTWTKLGRRRPFFLVGALLASAALVAMPNSSAVWMAAGLLWILDASINISMEPFRAFVGDKLPERQRASGFAMQSLFIGLGSVLASSLPWLLTNVFGVVQSEGGNAIPTSVHLAFYIGAGMFLAAVLWTIFSTPEDPPADLAAFAAHKRETAGPLHAFKEIWQGILTMPPTMLRLAPVQFFTWFGLFCMWIYFTPAIARHVFHAETGSPEYKSASEWVGVCFSTYNLVCFLFSFALLRLTRRYSPKDLHTVCLLIGGLGLLGVLLVGNQYLLLVPMVAVGVAWASIVSMPYAMLSATVPAERMGFYMGVFNFFIVIPQIVASLGLGKIMNLLLGGDSLRAILLGGASLLVAAVLTRRV